ncbi:inner membrane protein YbjM, partial [Salmonella enterica subsp. enterica serovar Kentucky]|nr:inner membrane protein YbjM [Salmonella enterica subsp. enterica serovar Kentucky]
MTSLPTPIIGLIVAVFVLVWLVLRTRVHALIAMLAAPFCLVLMRVVFMPTRSFWQELAWLFSAVFWCALGALC